MGGHIRMNLKEIGINTRNLVDSVQDRDYWTTLMNAALNLRVPQVMDLVGVSDTLIFQDVPMTYRFL